MSSGNPLYGQSMTRLTDLYELTMAYGYWKTGRAEHDAVFHLFFRKQPFGSGPICSALHSVRESSFYTSVVARALATRAAMR